MSYFTWVHERLDDTIIGYRALNGRTIVEHPSNNASVVCATAESMRDWLHNHGFPETVTVQPIHYGNIFNTFAASESSGIAFSLDETTIANYWQASRSDTRYQLEIRSQVVEGRWVVRTAFDLYSNPISDLREELENALLGFCVRLPNAEFFVDYERRRAIFGSREECLRLCRGTGDGGEPESLLYPRYRYLQAEGIRFAQDDNGNQRLNAIRGWEELWEIVEEDDRRAQEAEEQRANQSAEVSAPTTAIDEELRALAAAAVVESDPWLDYSPAYWRSRRESDQAPSGAARSDREETN